MGCPWRRLPERRVYSVKGSAAFG
ncbi:UNVERIFIED_CONTAM: hypothetical protein GTU68_028425 [Idotea baltica]|nr:hypothetical protein [Idotea baltica]